MNLSPQNPIPRSAPLNHIRSLVERPIVLDSDPSRRPIQLAGLYYAARALALAEAVETLLREERNFEAALLTRTLYNLAVDFLWICCEPVPRAQRFYDATGVALSTRTTRYAGTEALSAEEMTEAIASNETHASRVRNEFVDKKGKIRREWAPGSIRDRADAIAAARPGLDLARVYDTVYGELSAIEHTEPFLAFEVVKLDGDRLAVAPRGRAGSHLGQPVAQVTGVVLSAILVGLSELGLLDPAELPSATTATWNTDN